MGSATAFDILMVDDDPIIIRLLRHALAEFFPLRFATSGTAALALARASKPDLVLVDLDMPGMNGLEVCQEFKTDAALSDVPVVIMLPEGCVSIEALGPDAGAQDYFTKPLYVAAVLARVRMYSQIKSLSDTVRAQVSLDFVTGSVNRRQMKSALRQEWLRRIRSGTPLSILQLRIDEFSSLHERAGEQQGDACLGLVASLLREVLLRPGDLLGHVAVGKFAMLLPDTDAIGALKVARKAIQVIDDARLLLAGMGPLRISVGGCSVVKNPEVGTSADIRSGLCKGGPCADPAGMTEVARNGLEAAVTVAERVRISVCLAETHGSLGA